MELLNERIWVAKFNMLINTKVIKALQQNDLLAGVAPAFAFALAVKDIFHIWCEACMLLSCSKDAQMAN